MTGTPVFHKLPVLPVIVACLILGIELVIQAGALGLAGGAQGIGWRMQWVTRAAFFDPLFEHWRGGGRVAPREGLRFLSYTLVHASLVQAFFGAVLVLALGKAVSERFSALAVMSLMLAGGVAGALVWGLSQNTPVPLIGVFPAVYGLIGGWSFILFTARDDGRGRLMAFRLVAVLFCLQLIFGLLEPGARDWIADLAGFGAGFGLSWLVEPGGGARLRRWHARTRQR